MSVKEKLIGLADVIRKKTGKIDKLNIDNMIQDVATVRDGHINPENLMTVLMSGSGNETVLVDDTITNLRTFAFYKVTGVAYAEFRNVGTTGNSVFTECTDLKILKLPKCKIADASLCSGCTELEYVFIPQCQKICRSAFYNCRKLLKAELENSTVVESSAFEGCRLLSEIYLPVCSSLSEKAFKGCSSLKHLMLPAMKYISEGCFEESGLEHLDMLGQSGGFIARRVFRNTGLTSLVIRNDIEVLSLFDVNAFEDTPISRGEGKIYVPEAVIGAYRMHNVWKNFADRIVSIEGSEFECKSRSGLRCPF